MITCTDFQKQLGMHCSQINKHGKQFLYISTPFQLSGSKPIDLFLLQSGDSFTLTDDGMTIAELMATGFDLTHKASWKGLSLLGLKHGFELEEDGAFVGHGKQATLTDLYRRGLMLAAGICEWERDKIDECDKDLTLYHEVEAILRHHREPRELKLNPTLELGNRSFSFDFDWGGTLIDAIKPNQQAVNARLRKSITLTKLLDDDAPPILYVIDDRSQPGKAREERAVLGGIAKTTLLSDLRLQAA